MIDLSNLADELRRIEAEITAHPDRSPDLERIAFINELDVIGNALRAAGLRLPFFASMVNRLSQSDPQNAYPHFDQAFAGGAEASGERNKKGYMERMKTLVPVALVRAVMGDKLTRQQAVYQIAPVLVAAGYPVTVNALMGWCKDAARSTMKTDKAEQLERAMRIVAAEWEKDLPQAERMKLVADIAARY